LTKKTNGLGLRESGKCKGEGGGEKSENHICQAQRIKTKLFSPQKKKSKVIFGISKGIMDCGEEAQKPGLRLVGGSLGK